MTYQRPRIELDTAEAIEFLQASRTLICATHGPRGWPHASPLWFVVDEAIGGSAIEVWSWTYRESQKVRNLERDPRSTLLVEDGEGYSDLRGLMIEADVELVDDARKLDVARQLVAKYTPRVGSSQMQSTDTDHLPQSVARQVRKRLALRFVERRRVSWDHRKLLRS